MLTRQLDIFNDNSYHNSLPERDENILEHRESAARKQEEQILKFFQDHKYQSFTPYQVWLAFGQQWPKSSIQRAITNMTQKRYKLYITGERRPGEYPNTSTNCWKLKT